MMKLYRIRPVAEQGNYPFRDLVPCDTNQWFTQSRALLEAGKPLPMQWNNGTADKPIAELIPATAPGLVLGPQAAALVGRHCQRGTPFQVVTPDGQTWAGYAPANFTPGTGQPWDHVFVMYPTHAAFLVTEAFRQAWDAVGLTGADFEAIDELAADFVTPQS